MINPFASLSVLRKGLELDCGFPGGELGLPLPAQGF